MQATDELRDRMELRQLVEQYARACDTRDPELFAEVFTDDAVLHTHREDIRGRAALLAVPPGLNRYLATMHFVGNHYVAFGEPGSDRATGQTYCIAQHLMERGGERRDYVMMIRYDDEYVRIDGEWRIAERRLVLLWDEERRLRP